MPPARSVAMHSETGSRYSMFHDLRLGSVNVRAESTAAGLSALRYPMTANLASTQDRRQELRDLLIRRRRGELVDGVVAVDRDGLLPLSWQQRGLWFLHQWAYSAGLASDSAGSVAYLAHVIGFAVGVLAGLAIRVAGPSPPGPARPAAAR